MSDPAVVPTSLPGSYGVCVDFVSSLYATSPTWTRLDDPTAPVHGYKNSSPYNCNCVSNWTVDRGRSYELDKPQAGTASITLEDPNGLFDPTNINSPFYNNITPGIAPMKRAKISMQNPVNKQYYDIFTGWIESWAWTITTEEKLMTVTLNLVDGFELLTRSEIPPDTTGTTVFAATSDVATRINALLDIAGWPVDPGDNHWRKIHSGNVFLQQTIYNPQTQILSAIQDAADAEFPGVANFWIAKNGAAMFLGRYPRFQPQNYPDDVNFWNVGDEAGASTYNGARIQDIQWNMDSKNIINASLAYPNLLAAAALPGQIYTNGTSIAAYGLRTESFPDLINGGQPSSSPSPSQPAADSATSCWFFAKYYVDNYAFPQLRISNLVFSSRPTSDSHTWDLITGAEVNDILTIYTNDPGGGGFGNDPNKPATAHQFFVEGLHYSVNPLTADYPDVSLRLDVSPRNWFNISPWSNPYITLSPPSAKEGATVTVSGMDFTPSSSITSHKFAGTGISLTPGTPSTNASGAFTATFTVPSGLTGGTGPTGNNLPGSYGRYTVEMGDGVFDVIRLFGLIP